MKKLNKIVLSTVIACLLLFTSVGCAKTQDIAGLNGRKLIDIVAYDGGYGSEYALELAREFNATDEAGDYAINIIPEMKAPETVLAEINTQNPVYRGYIFAGCGIVNGIYRNNLEDLSDLLDDEVDGPGNGTIRDKMNMPDEWCQTFSKNGEGMYVLPYTDSVTGFMYDHRTFVENDWYYKAENNENVKSALTAQEISFTESGSNLIFTSSTGKVNYIEGDTILSAGKDGKYGTYDDGQPITEAQFKEVMDKIAITASPIIYPGGVDISTNYIFDAAIAQYMGVDDFHDVLDYDTGNKQFELHGGTKITFNIKNGYKINELEAVYQSLKFMNSYFNNSGTSSKYLHSLVKDKSKNHLDAQNTFLLGYRNNAGNKLSAMLVDGMWWENEAKEFFNALGAQDASRGFGQREYRIMLLPDFEGQKSDKSVIAAGDAGSLFLTKDSNKERLAVSKAFFRFLLKDSSLAKFTTMTGNLLNYKYELSDNDLAKLTPFTRNVFEMVNDTEHIAVARAPFYSYSAPINFATSKGTYGDTYFHSEQNLIKQDCIATCLTDYGFNQTWAGLKTQYSATEWDDLYKEAQRQGFYAE